MTTRRQSVSSDSADETVRRRARFQETGDPSALWPGLEETARVAAAGELGRVVERVLAGERQVRLDLESVHTAYALGIAAHTTGVGPLLGHWIEVGIATARADVDAVFARHLRHARARSRRIDDEVLPALDTLLAAGLTPIILKGFHTSRVLFDEPGVRRMSDVDLLFPPDRIEEVESVLTAIGFRADGPALRPYKRDWIGGDVDPRLYSVELAHERSKWTIELHTSLDRTFAPGAVATLDELRDRVEHIEICGRSVLALDPAAVVVMLACHCSHELDGVRLLRLFELVSAVRHWSAEARLDWTEIIRMIDTLDIARFTYPAFKLANDLAPGTIDPRVVSLGERNSTPAARHTVSRSIPSGGSLDDRSVVRQLMWTTGPVAIGHRLWRTVWPASGWRARLRRLRSGVLSFFARDERRAGSGA
jgi:hypothetical protein